MAFERDEFLKFIEDSDTPTLGKFLDKYKEGTLKSRLKKLNCKKKYLLSILEDTNLHDTKDEEFWKKVGIAYVVSSPFVKSQGLEEEIKKVKAYKWPTGDISACQSMIERYVESWDTDNNSCAALLEKVKNLDLSNLSDKQEALIRELVIVDKFGNLQQVGKVLTKVNAKSPVAVSASAATSVSATDKEKINKNLADLCNLYKTVITNPPLKNITDITEDKQNIIFKIRFNESGRFIREVDSTSRKETIKKDFKGKHDPKYHTYRKMVRIEMDENGYILPRSSIDRTKVAGNLSGGDGDHVFGVSVFISGFGSRFGCDNTRGKLENPILIEEALNNFIDYYEHNPTTPHHHHHDRGTEVKYDTLEELVVRARELCNAFNNNQADSTTRKQALELLSQDLLPATLARENQQIGYAFDRPRVKKKYNEDSRANVGQQTLYEQELGLINGDIKSVDNDKIIGAIIEVIDYRPIMIQDRNGKIEYDMTSDRKKRGKAVASRALNDGGISDSGEEVAIREALQQDNVMRGQRTNSFEQLKETTSLITLALIKSHPNIVQTIRGNDPAKLQGFVEKLSDKILTHTEQHINKDRSVDYIEPAWYEAYSEHVPLAVSSANKDSSQTVEDYEKSWVGKDKVTQIDLLKKEIVKDVMSNQLVQDVATSLPEQREKTKKFTIQKLDELSKIAETELSERLQKINEIFAGQIGNSAIGIEARRGARIYELKQDQHQKIFDSLKAALGGDKDIEVATRLELTQVLNYLDYINKKAKPIVIPEDLTKKIVGTIHDKFNEEKETVKDERSKGNTTILDPEEIRSDLYHKSLASVLEDKMDVVKQINIVLEQELDNRGKIIEEYNQCKKELNEVHQEVVTVLRSKLEKKDEEKNQLISKVFLSPTDGDVVTKVKDDLNAVNEEMEELKKDIKTVNKIHEQCMEVLDTYLLGKDKNGIKFTNTQITDLKKNYNIKLGELKNKYSILTRASVAGVKRTLDNISAHATSGDPSKKTARTGSVTSPASTGSSNLKKAEQDFLSIEDGEKYDLHKRLKKANKKNSEATREALEKLEVRSVVESSVNMKSIDALSNRLEKITQLNQLQQSEGVNLEQEKELASLNTKPAINIISEGDHSSEHGANVSKLTERIRTKENIEEKIAKDTVILLERKNYGDNLGMQDVIRLANIMEHNSRFEKGSPEKIRLPKGIKENPMILADAKLYMVARKEGVKVIGMEGSNLASSYKENYNEHEQNREQYMVSVISEVQSKGYNVIVNMGSAHAEKLQSKLEELDVRAGVGFNKIVRNLKKENINDVKETALENNKSNLDPADQSVKQEKSDIGQQSEEQPIAQSKESMLQQRQPEEEQSKQQENQKSEGFATKKQSAVQERLESTQQLKQAPEQSPKQPLKQQSLEDSIKARIERIKRRSTIDTSSGKISPSSSPVVPNHTRSSRYNKGEGRS